MARFAASRSPASDAPGSFGGARPDRRTRQQAMSDTFVTYAQNAEDLMLWRALRHIGRGFYIDVGAQDPVADSVTKAFYEHGWRGINIEPVEYWYQRLVADRSRDINLRAAASDRADEMTMFEIEGTGLSTSDAGFAAGYRESGKAVREVVVQCRTLDDICAEYEVGAVHFLKVDCEGCEKPALQGITLRDLRPWIILVEATEPNSTKPTHQQWEHLLTGQGYEFIYFDGLNRFYLAEEHRDLRDKFCTPLEAEQEIWRSQVRNLQQENQRREQALAEAREFVHKLKRESRELNVEIDRMRVDFASVSEKSALIGQANRVLEAQFAERIDSIHALEREIERLRRDFASISEKRALAEQDKCALEAQMAKRAEIISALEVRLAGRVEDIHALGREIERLRREFASISKKHAEAERVGQVLQTQLAEKTKLNGQLESELVWMRTSHSWKLTAPLRRGRRVLGRLGSNTWTVARPVIRPLARLLRPLLRRLSRSHGARRVAVLALGTNSAPARHLRLFLFGPVVQSSTDDSEPPAPRIDVKPAPIQPSHSRRQREVLGAFQNTRLRDAAVEDRSCE
jgi:FkbM family methyltransferase